MSVGNLNVTVSATTGQARREINSFRSDLGSLKSTSSSVAGGVSGITVAVVGLGVAVATTAVKLAMMGMENLDKLDESAGKVGTTTEKLAGLHLAADRAGISSNKLDANLIRQAKSISDATQGLGRGAAALDKMGLSANDLNSMSTDEQLRAIAVATAGLATHQEKLNVVTAIYGARGADMLNVLNLNADGLDRAQQSAEEFGLAVDGALVKHVAEAQDAMDGVGSSITGLGNSLAVTLAQPMEEAAEFVSGLINGIRGLVDWFNELPGVISPATKALREKEEADKKAADAAGKHAASMKAQEEALKPYRDAMAKLKQETEIATLGKGQAQFNADKREFGEGKASALQEQRDLAENARAERAEQEQVAKLKQQIADWGKTSLQIERDRFALSAVGKTKQEGLAAFAELEQLESEKKKQEEDKARLDKERQTLAELRREVDDFGKSSTEQQRSRTLADLTDPKARSEANRLFDQLQQKEIAQREREARRAVADRQQPGILDANSAEGFAALRANVRGSGPEKLLEETKKQSGFQERMVTNLDRLIAAVDSTEGTVFSIN